MFELARIQQICCEWEPGKFYFELEAIINNMAFCFENSFLTVPCVELPLSNTSEINTTNKPVKQDCLTVDSQTILPIMKSKDAELFGDLWPLTEQLKLDMAQTRDRLNAQSERLNQLGYIHDMKTQVWYKSS
jgi:hypothetical protein